MVKIICSALYIRDGNEHQNQPVNIDTGFIVCGRRHSDCYYTISLMGNKEYKHMVGGRSGQGFLTTDNRFVDRKEAYTIAKSAGQLLHDLHDLSNPQLCSEDLW